MAVDIWRDRIKLGVQTVISFAVLGGGFYAILSGRYSPEVAEWAAGLIGVVVGYWLR